MTEAPYSHIACCIDESAGSERAFREAQRLRAFGPGRLTLIHVASPPIVYGEAIGAPLSDEITDAASKWLAGQSAKVPESQAVLLSGHPASSVCDWAREHQPDLLVAGAHRGHLERVALGSFASYLAYHAPCPVLLVRPVEY
jgi:nucleotide-binding universal stress UspA family protein